MHLHNITAMLLNTICKPHSYKFADPLITKVVLIINIIVTLFHDVQSFLVSVSIR